MPDSPNTINQRVGVIEWPYSDTDVDTAEGTITDPAQSILLALFKAAINDEFAGAFQKASAGTPLAGKLPVQDVWPGKWTPQAAKQRKADFPLLALYRSGQGDWNEVTLGCDQLTQRWGLDLILGPLDVADEQRLGRALPRIAVLLQRVIRQRGHKAYQNGACLWGVQSAGSLSSIWLDHHESGPAQFAGDDGGVAYLALSAQLTTTEVSSDVEGLDPDLTEMTLSLNVGGSDGMIPALVIANADTLGDFSNDFSDEFAT